MGENELVSIAKLQTSVEVIKTDMTEIKGDIKTILGNCNTEKITQNSTCSEVTQLKLDIKELKEDKANGKKWFYNIAVPTIISVIIAVIPIIIQAFKG
jgi:peptidoglycan hydrolase CwlO-like protein